MNTFQHRVLITGAFATGKTKMCRRVAERLRTQGISVVIVDEVARSCPFALNENQTLMTSLWLTLTQISKELEADNSKAEIVIVDRSITDILSHTRDIKLRDSSEQTLNKALHDLCRKWCCRYSLVFLAIVDHERPIEADAVRSPSKVYQARLEGHLMKLLNDLKISYDTLPVADAERDKVVIKKIHEIRTRA